jgi:hypothetical protein
MDSYQEYFVTGTDGATVGLIFSMYTVGSLIGFVHFYGILSPFTLISSSFQRLLRWTNLGQVSCF